MVRGRRSLLERAMRAHVWRGPERMPHRRGHRVRAADDGQRQLRKLRSPVPTRRRVLVRKLRSHLRNSARLVRERSLLRRRHARRGELRRLRKEMQRQLPLRERVVRCRVCRSALPDRRRIRLRRYDDRRFELRLLRHDVLAVGDLRELELHLSKGSSVLQRRLRGRAERRVQLRRLRRHVRCGGNVRIGSLSVPHDGCHQLRRKVRERG